MDGRQVDVAGAAHLVLLDGVRHLHPEEATVEAMLADWEVQQRSHRLAPGTVTARLALARRFLKFCNEYPWPWTPADLEEWTVSLLSEPNALTYSTMRTYQQAVAMFCDYLVDARYGWGALCEEPFGTPPVQICHGTASPTPPPFSTGHRCPGLPLPPSTRADLATGR